MSYNIDHKGRYVIERLRHCEHAEHAWQSIFMYFLDHHGLRPRDDENLVLQPHDYEEELIYGCSSTDIQYNCANAKLVILK